MRAKLFLLTSLFASLPVHAGVEIPADAAPAALPEPPAAEPSATEKALAASPGLYHRRDRSGAAQQGVDLMQAALAEDPDNFDLHWNIARFYFWLGDTAPDDTLRTQHSKSCWDHAIRATELSPNAVEGHYWSMACIGTYSEGVGIINAVRQGLATKFQEAGERAEAIDRNHDSGGPMRGLGRFHHQLPWPLQDMDEARSYLERANAVDPTHGRNLYYMAELEIDDGNEEAGRALLQRLLALSESGNKNPPEVRRQQAAARATLAELDD